MISLHIQTAEWGVGQVAPSLKSSQLWSREDFAPPFLVHAPQGGPFMFRMDSEPFARDPDQSKSPRCGPLGGLGCTH